MAWEARSGLKPFSNWPNASDTLSRNGLGSPFGIETIAHLALSFFTMFGRNGLGSPFGIET